MFRGCISGVWCPKQCKVFVIQLCLSTAIFSHVMLPSFLSVQRFVGQIHRLRLEQMLEGLDRNGKVLWYIYIYTSGITAVLTDRTMHIFTEYEAETRGQFISASNLERFHFPLPSLLCWSFNVLGVLNTMKRVFAVLQQGLAGGFGFDEQTPSGLFGKASAVTTATSLALAFVCVGREPALMWPGVVQHLGGERFVYFTRKKTQQSSLEGRVGAPNTTGKLRRALRTYFSSLESSGLNKAIPGLSHLFARCGFSHLLER